MFLLEVVHDSKYLLSDNYETIKATEILAKEGFVVMPYMYPDLNAARELADVGAACVMPLSAPIGSNKGLATKDFIQILIDEIDLPIIVDAGIGRPSQACEDMEMGAKAVMANTAIATAGDVQVMAEAFKKAIEAQKLGATYISAGHIFATDYKKDLPPRGLEFLKEVCNSVTIPVYAIGGIKLSDVQMDEIIKCGAKGGCIMSGMMSL